MNSLGMWIFAFFVLCLIGTVMPFCIKWYFNVKYQAKYHNYFIYKLTNEYTVKQLEKNEQQGEKNGN